MISPRIVGLATFCFVLLGCGSPLVGLECREGFTRCGDACYDLRSDPAHCGRCTLACGVAESCVESACVPGPPDGGGPGDGGSDIDASRGDGGTDMDASLEGGAPDDGSTAPDALVPPNVPCTGPGSPLDCACDLGQLKCDLTCVDALTDRLNCGDCGIQCTAQQVCAAGSCAALCGAALHLCGDICVDWDEDLAHCGACDNPCLDPGAACVNGTCVGSAVGHIVAIGHALDAPPRPPMRTLVGNAVFLVRSSPVRVLIYDAATSNDSRVNITDAIVRSSMLLGRQVEISQTTAEQVSLQLSVTDVFVIAPQQGATNDALIALGRGMWPIALRTFLERGGVVLLFDAADASSPNDGTYQILGRDGAQLLPVIGRSAAIAANTEMSLLTLSDAIAAGVPNRYVSTGLSAAFAIDASAFVRPTEVVRDPSNRPVVIHQAAVE